MGRKLKQGQAAVEPKRWRLDSPPDWDSFDDKDRFVARDTHPIRVGDVIYVDPGVEALVVTTLCCRVHEFDPTSALLPVCKVRKRTKKGAWSNLWTYAWPGDVDRGYAAALGGEQKSSL